MLKTCFLIATELGRHLIGKELPNLRNGRGDSNVVKRLKTAFERRNAEGSTQKMLLLR